MLLQLIRLEDTKEGRLGVLRREGIVLCATLEPPWQDNKTRISCIPTGVYSCARVNSPRFHQTFEILDVPGRTHILFHVGNLAKDTDGCVLLGKTFGELENKRAVLSSKNALTEFMRLLAAHDCFALDIIEV